VNLSHRDCPESKETCTALLYFHVHCVPVIIQCFMISAHWDVPVHSPQFLYAIYISYYKFELKREISRTMTFCLCYANTFIERYEKTLTDFTQFAFSVRRKVQIKPLMDAIFYTDRESLSDRWVLSNTLMKTIYLKCFANKLHH